MPTDRTPVMVYSAKTVAGVSRFHHLIFL